MNDYRARRQLARDAIQRVNAIITPLLDPPDRGLVSLSEHISDAAIEIHMHTAPGRSDLARLLCGKREAHNQGRGRTITAINRMVRGMREARDLDVQISVALFSQGTDASSTKWLEREPPSSSLSLDAQRAEVLKYLRMLVLPLVDAEDVERVAIETVVTHDADTYLLNQVGPGKSLRGLFLGRDGRNVQAFVVLSQAFACAQGFERAPQIHVTRDPDTAPPIVETRLRRW